MSGSKKTKKKKASQVSSLLEKLKGNVNPRRLISIIVTVVFVGYFLYIMIWQQIVISNKSNQIIDLEEKYNTAEQQRLKLEEELGNKDDPEYIEKYAREKLGLIRPNERVFVDANKSDVNQGN